jgi:hypothetical protein
MDADSLSGAEDLPLDTLKDISGISHTLWTRTSCPEERTCPGHTQGHNRYLSHLTAHTQGHIRYQSHLMDADSLSGGEDLPLDTLKDIS